jgi:hypothetical protein
VRGGTSENRRDRGAGEGGRLQGRYLNRGWLASGHEEAASVGEGDM